MSKIARKLLGFAFAAMLAVGVAPMTALASVSFSDVTNPKAWYYEKVYQAADMGLFSGYPDGTFRPDQTLTRSEAAVILWNYYCPEEAAAYDDETTAATNNTTGMSDVKSGLWYTAAANWAVANEVINGKDLEGGKYFCPNDVITREQLCAILGNAASRFGDQVITSDLKKFSQMPDADTTDSWAEKSIAWGLDNGVLSGKTNDDGTVRLAPLEDVTRAQMATMVLNSIDNNLLLVQTKLDHFTWAELTDISNQIAAAGTEEEALSIAKANGLVGEDGKLVGDETKVVTLTNNVRAKVQILGFNHDANSATGEKVGITFGFISSVDSRSMNNSGTAAGSWSTSDMRAYLNSTDFLNLLPEDLTANLKTVAKSSYGVTTADTIWLMSFVECYGNASGSNTPHFSFDMTTEGSQYQLYADNGVTSDNPTFLIRSSASTGSATDWWLRTVTGTSYNCFSAVKESGKWGVFNASTKTAGVCPVFAI